jgi:hypothetical protein
VCLGPALEQGKAIGELEMQTRPIFRSWSVRPKPENAACGEVEKAPDRLEIGTSPPGPA